LTVETTQRGRILVIAMRRPEKRNALNAEITRGLDAALNRLEDDPDLWCGVLTGTDTLFSAGADLAAGPGEPTPRGGLVGLVHRHRTKPLVAAVEGYALGGGMELVLCCDLVVAADDATFGLPEVARGLIPDFGGAFRAPRALPPNVARELMLTGDRLSAARAEHLGFVNRLTVPGGALDGAIELAERVCENAPRAVSEAIQVVDAAVAGDESGLWARTEAAHGRLLASEDLVEGLDAFFARRAPSWRNR
jgi:enoyl-CoA hydratase/carnithine racemase